jgi:hypothetical protein
MAEESGPLEQVEDEKAPPDQMSAESTAREPEPVPAVAEPVADVVAASYPYRVQCKCRWRFTVQRPGRHACPHCGDPITIG